MKQMMFFAVLLLFSLQALSQSISYNINASLPLFTHYYGYTAEYYHRDTGIVVATAGTYTFDFNTENIFDSYILLYDAHGFDPVYQYVNLIDENDDDEANVLGVGSSITIDLLPGVYTFVGTSNAAYGVGDALLSISGPSTVLFDHPVLPPPLIEYSISSSSPIYTVDSKDLYHRDTGITVSTAGTYTFIMNSNNDFNTYATLYDSHGFNPLTPDQYVISSNDDDPLGFLRAGSRIVADLQPGNYVLVGAGAQQLATGRAQIKVDGPAPVTYIPAFFNNPLPLKLLAFSASFKDDIVQITWVASEDGLGGDYMIQKSGDGRTFTDWKKIEAGFGTGNTTYQQSDEKPMPGDGFYRLQINSKDGSKSYSQVVKVSYLHSDKSVISAKLYSNPSVNSLHIILYNQGGQDQPVSVLITDDGGRTFINEKRMLAQTLDVSYNLKPGTYIVKMYSIKTKFSWVQRVLIR